MFSKFAIFKLFRVVVAVSNTLRLKPASFAELGKKSVDSQFLYDHPYFSGLTSPSPGSSGLAEGSDYGSWPAGWNNMWVCCIDDHNGGKYCGRHSGPIPIGCSKCSEGTVCYG